ncbi:hypothetical protein CBS101457_001125 [Exobasidium rhododendri]|nr:hypothetical protein CBS101457_001125 [Exobasidium rhododendri]
MGAAVLERIDDIVFLAETPTGEEHYDLRKAAGLTPPPRPENQDALQRSWYCVTLRDASDGKKRVIGMGRIVGDGMFLYVTDMAILPEFQRKGLGAKTLKLLLKQVDENAPKARLALEGDPPGVNLYQRHGFLHQTFSKPMVRSTHFPAGPQPE